MNTAIYMRVATFSQVDSEVVKKPVMQLRKYVEGQKMRHRRLSRIFSEIKKSKKHEFVLK